MAGNSTLRTLLYEALAQPIGLLIETSDRQVFTQRLYKARRDAGDPALNQLQFRASPLGEGTLIIVKERVEVPEGAEGAEAPEPPEAPEIEEGEQE